jgi:2-polyprenyl-3-methyl-5-hydroxy-6-metoxy-1,4-benzoquinol methylase
MGPLSESGVSIIETEILVSQHVCANHTLEATPWSHLTDPTKTILNKQRLHLDPVAAYDLLASQFPAIANRRKRYLDAVNDLIVSRIPIGGKYLLDVGAGDGSRAREISSRAEIDNTVLLEPSSMMIRNASGQETIWTIRAEDLVISDETPRFDVITCLWNVMGHIGPSALRATVLCRLRDLLTYEGRLFLDVTHRYNVRSYGMIKTALRYVLDHAHPRDTNGDVIANWSLGATECSTYGHVFTDREMRRLAGQAGLRVEACIPVDYETGATTNFLVQGNLLYELRL